MLQLAQDRLQQVSTSYAPVPEFVYHISPATSHEEVKLYGRKLARFHAEEFSTAINRLKLKDYFRGPVDVIDIGCGHGMSCYALRAAGLNIQSFQGFDHNEHMINDARRIALNLEDNSMFPKSVEFFIDFNQLSPVKHECLMVINHVLNQRFVLETTLEDWCNELDRLTPDEFILISIEPHHSNPANKLLLRSIMENTSHRRTWDVVNHLNLQSKSSFQQTKDVEIIRVGKTGDSS
jgi:trans-aconitate methyltransferase